jgi:hypothetical protein
MRTTNCRSCVSTFSLIGINLSPSRTNPNRFCNGVLAMTNEVPKRQFSTLTLVGILVGRAIEREHNWMAGSQNRVVSRCPNRY